LILSFKYAYTGMSVNINSTKLMLQVMLRLTVRIEVMLRLTIRMNEVIVENRVMQASLKI